MQISIDTSVLIGLLDSRDIEIPFIASFGRDFDQIAWLQRVSVPTDVDVTA